MRRREFIALVGGAVTWLLAARAQQAEIPVIGWLDPSSPAEGGAKFVMAFREGLSETGYVVGEYVTIEYRWAEGQVERLADLAADLVRRQVVVIAAQRRKGTWAYHSAVDPAPCR